MRHGIALCLLLGILCVSWHARAQSSTAAPRIEEASRALDAGDYPKARSLVQLVIGEGRAITRAERGEAFRILGLVNFFEGKSEMARLAFLEFLRTDPDVHLDPALVPPEAISLLEDVRARNAAELDAYRKKPKRKRYLLLNLVPTAGQFQNGERSKGFVLAGGIGLFLAANLGSYFWLQKNCDDLLHTCGSDGENNGTARTMQTTNLVSGVGLVALYAYSVLDGWLGYRKAEEREQHSDDYMSFDLRPTQDGASFAWSLAF